MSSAVTASSLGCAVSLPLVSRGGVEGPGRDVLVSMVETVSTGDLPLGWSMLGDSGVGLGLELSSDK